MNDPEYKPSILTKMTLNKRLGETLRQVDENPDMPKPPPIPRPQFLKAKLTREKEELAAFQANLEKVRKQIASLTELQDELTQCIEAAEASLSVLCQPQEEAHVSGK